MINLNFSRIWITEFNALYYLRNYRNVVSIPSKLTNIHNNFLFNLYNVNKFSTANTLLKSKDRYKEKKKVIHVNLDEIRDIIKVDHMISRFDGTIEKYKDQMIKNLPLRTRIGAIEQLTITFEDEEHKLEELVEINRKPNMIILNVSAFPQIVPSILEALSKSQMNLNPQQEGTTIYIPIPKITKEHREVLTKMAKQYFNKCKDIISDIRNEYVKELKNYENAPKDLIFKAEDYINVTQKEYVKKAEQLLKSKQKELLGE